MTAYDLTLEFIRIVEQLQVLIDKKSRASVSDYDWLDTDIDALELKMFEIKNKLKKTNVY